MIEYRPRHIEKQLIEFRKSFKVILVTGARQVGKSTLIKHVFPEMKAIVFDPLEDLFGARRDPDLFLDNFPSPLILDEIQFAPELLPALKRRVDQSDLPGQYILTGSQNLSMLQTVAESMAGRVGILQLEAMTPLELAGRGDQEPWLMSYLQAPDSLEKYFSGVLDELEPLPRCLWRGSMPGLLDLPDPMVPAFLQSYIQTYIERDIRTMGDIRNLSDFRRFLGLNAALSSQEINDSQIGREIGITPTTARKWRDLLSYSYQWLEIAPYFGNSIKRVSGKRKGIVRDTGIACTLQRLSTPDALPVSPLFGALFETWVLNHIHQQFASLSPAPVAYHWRSAGGAEVDIVLEYNGCLYPIEVKCKSMPNGHDTRGLRAFRETYERDNVMRALIIHGGKEIFRLDGHTLAIPWNVF